MLRCRCRCPGKVCKLSRDNTTAFTGVQAASDVPRSMLRDAQGSVRPVVCQRSSSGAPLLRARDLRGIGDGSSQAGKVERRVSMETSKGIMMHPAQPAGSHFLVRRRQSGECRRTAGGQRKRRCGCGERTGWLRTPAHVSWCCAFGAPPVRFDRSVVRLRERSG